MTAVAAEFGELAQVVEAIGLAVDPDDVLGPQVLDELDDAGDVAVVAEVVALAAEAVFVPGGLEHAQAAIGLLGEDGGVAIDVVDGPGGGGEDLPGSGQPHELAPVGGGMDDENAGGGVEGQATGGRAQGAEGLSPGALAEEALDAGFDSIVPK